MRHETNGRGADDGTQEDDYVIAILDRDANMGLYRIARGGKWTGPLERSANIDTIVHAMEQDARERGVHGVAVFQSDGEGTTQVGNVVNGRYQESGGYQGNGRATTVDTDAARELDLYIANTFELVGAPNSIGKSIDTNLKRKLASGKYDSALSPKAWQYLVDQGAKRYEREFGNSSPVFNAATRRQVAADFARAWESENGMQPNARQIPEHMQRYRDFSNDELYEELISKGYTPAQARLHAKRGSHSLGKLDFLPPRVPAGWTVSPTPIFRKSDAMVAFEAHKGAKYMVFDQAGRPLSPELRAIRGLIEWRGANGWIDAQ